MEERKRTTVAGLSMIVGAVAMMAPPFLGPPNGADDTKQRLMHLASNPGPTMAKSFVFQLGVLLLLPGIAAIVGRTRGRGTGAVLSGAVAYGAGLIGGLVFMVMTGVEVSLAQSGPISSTLVHADDRIMSGPAVVPSLILAFLVFDLIGLPWLSFGMVRAQQIPRWLAALATVGTVMGFVGSGSIVEAVGREILGAALIVIALTLVRTPVRVSEPQLAMQPA